MNSLDRFNETFLPDKEAFYSSLNMEVIINVDYRHAKRVFKYFNNNNNNNNNQNTGDYHYLYAQSDTLLLTDVLENFRNMCLQIHELDLAHFLSTTELAWQAGLKETIVKLELLTDIDILLMVKK